MATPNRNAPRSSSSSDVTFGRHLRYEFADEEGRALLGSYGISFTLAILFLLFVYLTDPAVAETQLPQVVTIDVELPDPEEPEPEPQPEPAEAAAPSPAPAPAARRPTPSAAPSRTTSPGAIADAFGTPSAGTAGTTGDVSSILRGVDVASGGGGSGVATGQKAVIGTGTGGGAGTPGRGGVSAGGGTAGAGVGRVGSVGGIGRTGVSVAAPRRVDAPATAGPGRDMGELGTYVRSRMAELRYCYEEQGLKQNPSLAGTIHVAITIAAGGGVSNARVTNRTWSGAGVSGTESCILSRIRNWRFPASSTGEGTYSFPFNFTT